MLTVKISCSSLDSPYLLFGTKLSVVYAKIAEIKVVKSDTMGRVDFYTSSMVLVSKTFACYHVD